MILKLLKNNKMNDIKHLYKSKYSQYVSAHELITIQRLGNFQSLVLKNS